MDFQTSRHTRRFLFLQGPPSRFWARLADALCAEGHSITKVNFSLADRVFWGTRTATVFRRPFAEWPKYLEQLIESEKITDILYYNDGFPYHHALSQHPNRTGPRLWCVEFGYLRPDWITLEPDGMNAASRFPKTNCEMTKLAKSGAPPDLRVMYPHGFATEAISEVTFNLIQSFGWLYNPNFRSGRKDAAVLDYLGWLPHLLHLKRDRTQARELGNWVERDDTPFFLIPMQMEGDYQVRSSTFGSMNPFLRKVMGSFSAAAPPPAHLIIKAHPLESGLRNWRAKVADLAREHGIENRVHYVRGGDLSTMLRHVKGVVVLNSTVGVHGLLAGTPVYALGDPVYDLDGLRCAPDLDTFWNTRTDIDKYVVSDFLSALSTIQVKGSFYNRRGQYHAIAQIVSRLTDNGPNSPHILLQSRTARPET